METSIKFRGSIEAERNKYFIDALREFLGKTPMSMLHDTKRSNPKRKVMSRGKVR